LKIVSYNVNGIRSAINKGLVDWINASQADVVCLQEIKATPDQIDETIFKNLGYTLYWMSAQKKGYSGVALFCKPSPKNIVYGCGIDHYDAEGRTLRVDFEDLSVMSVYMPSGSSGDHRQAFKIIWLADFKKYIDQLPVKSQLVICGDFNICHQPIDIHNPTANKNSPGFTPEERLWFTQFLNAGFIDTFRYFNSDPHHYTWWSYMANARAKNRGWRIDYALASTSLESRLKRAAILHQARHSDHCPVLLELH
jgi:exodeoxyribonuclease-3